MKNVMGYLITKISQRIQVLGLNSKHVKYILSVYIL